MSIASETRLFRFRFHFVPDPIHINICCFVPSLMQQGKYASLMVQHPFTGPDCVTFVWGCYSVGQLMASAAVGPMADAGYARALFYICVPLAAQVLPFSLPDQLS